MCNKLEVRHKADNSVKIRPLSIFVNFRMEVLKSEIN